jgi:Fic family protein
MARGKRKTTAPSHPQALALPDKPEQVERQWRARLDALGGRRDRQPLLYRAYVPSRIAELNPVLDSQLIKLMNDAESACRTLNEDPPALLSLEALAGQLLRAEAVASSRIEGLIVSHRRLARAFFSPGRHDTAAEVVANVRASERAIELATAAEEFNEDTLLEIHRTLFIGTAHEDHAGLVREEQNWIGGLSSNPSTADFVPPPPEYVEMGLQDLLRFINREDLPAALQAAIAHAQFETIHPFLDGNGRVGRILIHVILRRRGIAPRYVPPVSLVLAGRAEIYIRGLTAYRFVEPEEWYDIFADALEMSAIKAREFARRVAALQEQWLEQADNPRPQAGARKLIALLPAHPVINAQTAQDLIGASSPATAYSAIERLVRADVLREIKTNKKRDRLWECVGLFDLLDSFERELAPTTAPSGTRP